MTDRFPTIYRHCLDAGVDITQEPIPVVPAAHYSCGGLYTDLYGRTNIIDLSAVGEAACTGFHGANRLASTSLLECVTMAREAAATAAGELAGSRFEPPEVRPWEGRHVQADEDLIQQDLNLIKATMWNYVGLVRTGRRLSRARDMLRELHAQGGRLLPRLRGLQATVEPAQRRADRPAGRVRCLPQHAQRRVPLPRRQPRRAGSAVAAPAVANKARDPWLPGSKNRSHGPRPHRRMTRARSPWSTATCTRTSTTSVS